MAALFEEADNLLKVTDSELQNGLLIAGFATGPMGLLRSNWRRSSRELYRRSRSCSATTAFWWL